MKFIASFFSKLFITYVNRIMEALGGYPESVLGRTLLAPLDRVKVLLQCQPALIQQGRLTESYKGFYDCISKITQNEGVLSLWRGNLLNILRYILAQPFNTELKKVVQISLAWIRPKGFSDPFDELKSIVLCVFFGIFNLAFVYPIDYAQILLANDLVVNGEPQYNGFFDVIAKTGISGMYKGCLISLTSVLIYHYCSSFINLFLKRVFIKKNSSQFKTIFFKNSVTLFSIFATYPLETTRRCMILSSQGAVESYYNILNQGGFSAFFKGTEATLFNFFISSIPIIVLGIFFNEPEKDEQSGESSRKTK